MFLPWLKKHWLSVLWVVVVTTAMILYYSGRVPAWIFYTLLIAMHVWIFRRIGIRIYKYRKRESKNPDGEAERQGKV